MFRFADPERQGDRPWIHRFGRQRRITDSAQNILKQIPSRAAERGLHVVDDASIVMLALWSLLLWERKMGCACAGRIGG